MLRRAWRPDQWGLHRFGQAEEDHRTVAAEACGLRWVWHSLEALFRIFPVVRHPQVACGIDHDVGDGSLQSTDVATRRRNRVAGPGASWTVGGTRAAQEGDRVSAPIRHPHVVVAVDGYAPRRIDALCAIESARDRAIGLNQGNVAAWVLDHRFIQADPFLG